MILLSKEALDLIFLQARTHHHWQDKRVPEQLLHDIYDAMKMGPTSTNASPLRVVFATSVQAKEKLKPSLMEANIPQVMAAPVTAIFAYDTTFYEKFDRLSPHNNAISWFKGDSQKAYALETARYNAALQTGYFILAARAFGLDCGPMAGFDASKVDDAFLAGTSWRTSLLCNLGYGDSEKLHPRAQRLSFEEACRVL